jgi:hypothetical protein
MGLADFLRGAGNQWAEGFAAKSFGPGWREKLAAQRAQIAGTEAQTEQTRAQTGLAQANTALAEQRGVTEGLEQEKAGVELEQKRAQVAEIERLVRAGTLPSSDLAAARFILEDSERKARQPLVAAQIDLARSGAEENRAQAEKARRMPTLFGGADASTGIPSTAAERKEMSNLVVIKQGLGKVKDLLNTNPGLKGGMGMIAGRYNDAKRRWTGAPIEVDTLYHITDNIADQLLRARSGAAITEGEFSRLRQLVPDPRTHPQMFQNTLKLFEDEVDRIMASKGGAPARLGGVGTGPAIDADIPGAASGAPEVWVKDPATGKLRRQ